MISVYIVLLFLGGLALNAIWLFRLDICRIDFLDGIIVGQIYYIIIPMCFFMIAGGPVVGELEIAYNPYRDLGATAVFVIGMYLFPALRFSFPQVPKTRSDTSDPRTYFVVICVFFLATSASFMMSGLAQGGHWQENLEGAFGNPLFLPIKYTANVSRNLIYAALLYSFITGRSKKYRVLFLGAVFSVFDALTTFNRVTAVYLIITALFLFKNRPVMTLFAGSACLWCLSIISASWPIFRGLATADGYTIQSFKNAWEIARQARESAPITLDVTLNSVFESSNIAVLNWIVQNYGTGERPFIPFSMFARPLTFAMPSSIWPDRPNNFGLTLGNDIAQLPHLALNSTLYGESFANFGWMWPLGLSVFVLFWHGVYRLIAPNARVVQAMGAFAAFALWRFDASFVGCAALLTAVLVFSLWITRIARIKPFGRFYFPTSRLRS